MGVIFILSSREVHLPIAHLFPLRDKGLHVVEYAGLGWLCANAAFATWPRATGLRRWVFSVLVAGVWGMSDELHQALVPGRSAEVLDLVADIVGAALGAAIWFKIKKSSAVEGGDDGRAESGLGG